MKDNKQRLFEVMKKVNPDFKQKLNEAPQPVTNPNFQLRTYGDLKKVINVIQLQQKGKKLQGIAVDLILGAIPYLGNVKTAFDVYKAAFSKPDNQKTGTWLDKIDVDDKVSAIVDDNVENGFIQAMSDIFNSKPDDAILEPDFDMNAEMSKYLAGNYDQRTITGVPQKQ